MSKDEKIIIAVAVLLITVVIIWRKPIIAAVTGDTSDEVTPYDSVGVSQILTPESASRGLSYLSYNQPWAFAPPVGNFLPSITAGQGNQTVNKPTNFESDISTYSFGA